MNNDIHSAVINVVHQQLPAGIPAERITENADLQNELGFDSLGLATIATDLHITLDFDLQYFAEKIGEIHTVSDLVRILEEALLINK